MVRPMAYPEIYPPEDPDYRPTAIARNLFLDRVDDETAAVIIDRLNASDATMRAAQLRVLGGAMARVPDDATAFAHRESRIMVNIAAFYDGPDDKPRRERWVTDFHAAIEQDDTGRLRQFRGRRGRSARPCRLPGRDLGSPARDQASVRPRERLPAQPERAAGRGLGQQSVDGVCVPAFEAVAGPASVDARASRYVSGLPEGVDDVRGGVQVNGRGRSSALPTTIREQLALTGETLGFAHLMEDGDVRIGRRGAADDLVDRVAPLQDRPAVGSQDQDASVRVRLVAQLLDPSLGHDLDRHPQPPAMARSTIAARIARLRAERGVDRLGRHVGGRGDGVDGRPDVAAFDEQRPTCVEHAAAESPGHAAAGADSQARSGT